jgi:SAM-dependent methyltransferase
LSSEYYDTYWSEHGFSPTGLLSLGVRRLLEEHTAEGNLIVDVGCGDGKVVAPWAAANHREYLGLDVAQRAVDKVRAAGFSAEIISEPPHLPLADGAADVAAIFEVLEHLADPEPLLREIRRILRPSGRLIATVPNAAYWVRRVELGLLGRFNPYGDAESIEKPWRDPHLRFFTRRSLSALLHSAGFQLVACSGHGHPVFSMRTRIEASAAMRVAMRLRPEFFAPSLHAVGQPG